MLDRTLAQFDFPHRKFPELNWDMLDRKFAHFDPPHQKIPEPIWEMLDRNLAQFDPLLTGSSQTCLEHVGPELSTI